MSVMTNTTPEIDEDTGCRYLVEKPVPWINDPDFEPDFPSDCYRILPCGMPIDPDARFGMDNDPAPFCSFHRVPMEMPLDQFEREVDAGRSWT